MKKYMVYDEKIEQAEHTDFEYVVGETIGVNSNSVYRCMRKEIINNSLYQFFKKGRVIYDFNY